MQKISGWVRLPIHRLIIDRLLNMKNPSSWIPKILVLSLAANLLFVLMIGYAVHKRGGMPYLEKRIRSISLFSHSSASSAEAGRDKLPYSSLYLNRKSVYEALPDEKTRSFF